MQNLRRGINRIFIYLLGASALFAAEPGYLLTVEGAYSLGQRYLPSGLASTYNSETINYDFTDYGGRFYRTQGSWGLGISLHLYSAFTSRALLTGSSAVTQDFIVRKNAEAGGSYTFSSGNYRMGLGWIPLQFRLRKTWVSDWFFTELGTGPAYGFGALEYVLSVSSGTLSAADSRYHKYSEWGWLTSAMIGVDFKVHSGLSVQLFTEGAWLYAKVRSPNLLTAENISAAQYFIRPGLAIALHF